MEPASPAVVRAFHAVLDADRLVRARHPGLPLTWSDELEHERQCWRKLMQAFTRLPPPWE
jgi:hypothetical protein